MFLEKRKEIAAKGAEGMDEDDAEGEKDAADDEAVRPNAIHLYGVDSMSTREIMEYLGNYAPSWVEWINDSSCNVVFEDEPSANRVLHMFSLPDEEGNKIEAVDRQRFRDTVHFQKPNGDRVPLSMRISTEADVRPERPNPNSMWARSLHRPNKFKRRESRGKKKKNNRRKSTGMDVGSKRGREDAEEGGMDDDAGGEEQGEDRMDKEAMLSASLEEVAGDRKKKRRRQSAPADGVMAKMFAKDLRSILSQPGKAVAASGDAEMKDDDAAAAGAAAVEAAAPAEPADADMAAEPAEAV